MLDQQYFDKVLPEELELMERPVRLTLHLYTGAEYMVHALIAAHPSYVVLKVYGSKEPPKHSKPWQAANPKQDAAVHDQVCIPYSFIAVAHLTARATKGDDALGFRAR
jgi:hypothetical protein